MSSPPTAYASTVSIPLPTDGELSPETAAKVKAGSDLNVTRMFAGTGGVLDGVEGLVKAVFEAQGIEPKLRELIILRTAKLLNCPYEWQANAVMARNVGCTPEEIDAMAADGTPPGLDEQTAVVIQVTDELTADGTLTDPTLQRLRDHFDDIVCRKLLVIIGWFNMLSRFLNACRVPLETHDKIGKNTSPLG